MNLIKKLEGGDDMREQGSPDDSNPPNCDKCDRTIEHCVKNECPHRKDDICIDRGILCPAIQKYFTPKEKPPEPLDAELLERIRNIKMKPMKTIGWFKRKLGKHHPTYSLVEKAELENLVNYTENWKEDTFFDYDDKSKWDEGYYIFPEFYIRIMRFKKYLGGE